MMTQPLMLSNLQDVHELLQKIRDRTEVIVEGPWDLDQNLYHCAHSIEFGLWGYPNEMPQIFQKTVGKLVFNYFDWRGYMRHKTNELIPGEIPVKEDRLSDGIERLEGAIEAFENWTQPLQRHRFYGKLSKKQYARAHTLHIANHLELIKFRE